MTREVAVAVIGAGQAGLAMSWQLARRGVDHVVLERSAHVAPAWRERWDSMRTITPGWMNALPGSAFPGGADEFVPKDVVASYLAGYADAHRLPVERNAPVRSLRREGGGFALDGRDRSLRAAAVVVATGAFQVPRVPAMSRALPEAVRQLHSSAYRNPGSVEEETVLVVGAGNSGTPIAAELARAGRKVTLAVGPQLQLPRRIDGAGFLRAVSALGAPLPELDPAQRAYEADVMWWLHELGFYDFPVDSEIGRRLSGAASDPYVGTPLEEVAAESGLALAGPVEGVRDECVCWRDGASARFDAVVWATGFSVDYGWIQVDGALAGDGRPVHAEGLSPIPGLCFLGQRWQRTAASALLRGVGRDAEFVAERGVLPVLAARS